jgi:DNA-directed RNA polymerase subunit alpha
MEVSPYENWQASLRPRELEPVGGANSPTYGQFVLRPLEAGFGTTLGNSLRRILLSSIQGASITSLRINGVLHEFSYLPGIVEDVTSVVLNMKGVLLQVYMNEPIYGRLSAQGQDSETVTVTAGDFIFDADCKVLNPDQVIATLTEETTLDVEIVVHRGRGYVPASQNKNPEEPLGTIAVDALFSPIQRVRYGVHNVRVGDSTDFEQLTMDVWTDGSVTPRDALAYAAKILKEQLQPFVRFAQDDEPQSIEPEVEEPEWNEWLFKRVDELELSVRSQNCLQNAGVEYIHQLVERSEAEMLKTKNFGRKSLNEIKEILADLSLSLGMKLTGFPKNRIG